MSGERERQRMQSDPRRTLEEAASRRLSCEIMSRKGTGTQGILVRIERGGVVMTVPTLRFHGGEDVRIWFSMDGQPYTFEASVIRVGVPVPDRTQDGLLVGFIDRWTEGETEAVEGKIVEIVPPSGPSISLLSPPMRLVEITVSGLSFVVPLDFKLIFVESGALQVRLGMSATGTEEISATVRSLAQGEDYILYHLQLSEVQDPDRHRIIIDALGR